MRNDAGTILAIGLLLVAGVAQAGSAPNPGAASIPEAPNRWVTDRAAFLSPAFATALDAQLGDYSRRTGHQVLVYIDRTTAGVPIDDWAVRAFERWRVGRKGVDDGLVLFIFSDDRRLRIEVGYGLEERVPDAVASRIISERMVPRIRAGDRDGAVREGVKALTAVIGGDTLAAPDGAVGQTTRRPSVLTLVFGGLLALLFVWLLITNPALAAMLIFSIGSGRGGGGGGGWGGGGGGGGFSGGGGRSGGGGASGSW